MASFAIAGHHECMAKKARAKSAFAIALRATRRALLLDQGQAAVAIGVSAGTISRWEGSRFAPDDRARKAFVRWASGLASPHRETLLEAIGVMLPTKATATTSAPSTATAPPSAAAKADRRKAIDAAVLAMADTLDVGPRSLRAAFVTLLSDVEAVGGALPELRDALTRAKAKRPA